MPKASPFIQSFNSGEVSVLVEGRTSLDMYPASMRKLSNFVAAPQGPALRRSGTRFVGEAYSNTHVSSLVPFEFSETQVFMLEFSNGKMRVFDETGVVLSGGSPYVIDTPYTSTQAQQLRYVQSLNVMYLMVPGTRPRKLSRYSATDWRLTEVELAGGPVMPDIDSGVRLTPSNTGNAATNATGTASAGGYSEQTYRITPARDLSEEAAQQAAVAANLADVYSAVSSTVGAGYNTIQYRIDLNYDGTIATNEINPEYPTVLSGEPTPDIPRLPEYAFDGDNSTFWESDRDQTGVLEFTPTVPFACTGYVIYAARAQGNASYIAKDYAPGTWTFEGWNGSAWKVLDSQVGYVLYDGLRSVYIKINNAVSYSKYRLNVTQCTRNGKVKPRVSALVMTSEASSTVTLTASGTSGINDDQGFLATDLGRLIRVRCTDNAYRTAKIISRASATQVTCKLEAEPLSNADDIRTWSLGYYSDTTGWPAVALFYEDRLWFGGATAHPDLIVGSVVGDYENFAQTDTFGEVLDDSAVVFKPLSRKLPTIQWLQSDEQGLLIGTSSGEFVVRSTTSNAAITARTLSVKPSTQRGSASVEPVKVDRQVLYVQGANRTIREFAYSYDVDGYRAPSMSQYASHLGAKKFVQMAYASEPYSIVWMRRDDGSLVGLTYNREEGVVGWHTHDVGGYVESIATLPFKDQRQDALWLVVRRTVKDEEGEYVAKRYVEIVMPFWDFGDTLSDAWYADCGLRYSGNAASVITGLDHLNGLEVVGLADGASFGPVEVVDGSISLPIPASEVVAGLPFMSVAITSRIEAGAGDGTSQGKTKRVHGVAVHVWDSASGEVGVVSDEEDQTPKYDPIPYSEAPFEFIETPTLRSGILKPVPIDAGYGATCALAFRQRGDQPLPLNIISLMPQLHTQDR